jgi:AcrR family transcriptional regulator
MDKSDGQSGRTTASASTREKLMTAAAELIAELGWGRVTTRAVAERAGLPHGAVSYHFRGKQELLTEATMFAFARAIPEDEFAALAGVADLIGFIAAEVADRDAIDPVLSRLMFEAMGEAERDPALRERMGAMLAKYRELMVRAVRAEQQRGAVFADAPADAIATLRGALGDGLLLHARLDPALDVHAALNALRALLAPRPS